MIFWCCYVKGGKFEGGKNKNDADLIILSPP